MADKIGSAAYTVASAGAAAVGTGVNVVATGTAYAVDKVDDGVIYAQEKWQGEPKIKPALMRDTFRSDIDNAR